MWSQLARSLQETENPYEISGLHHEAVTVLKEAGFDWP